MATRQGAIRVEIDFVKKYIEELCAIDSSFKTSSDDRISNQCRIKELCAAIDYHSQSIYKLIKDWETVIKRKEQTMELNEFMNEYKPLELLAEANDLRIIHETRCTIATNVKLEADTPNTAISKSDDAIWALTRLPFETLQKFNGNRDNWSIFKTTFDALVSVQKGSKLQKLSILFNHLEGEARKTVEHYCLEEHNYELVWNTLEQKYGDKQDHYRRLLEKITNVKEVSGLDKLRLIVSALNQIIALNIVTEPTTIAVIVKAALPLFAYKEWDKMYGNSCISDLSHMSKWLSTLLIKREDLEQKFPREFRYSPKNSSTRSGFEMKQRLKPIQSYATTQANRQATTPTEISCIFCSGQHWSDKCDRFATKNERMNIVKQKKLCFKCLKNHMSKDCTRRKPCFYCGGQHHSSLCHSHKAFPESTSFQVKSTIPQSVSLLSQPSSDRLVSYRNGKQSENVFTKSPETSNVAFIAFIKHNF